MVVHPIPALILAYIKRISQILFGLGMIMWIFSLDRYFYVACKWTYL
jgi:hypothetical protein